MMPRNNFLFTIMVIIIIAGSLLGLEGATRLFFRISGKVLFHELTQDDQILDWRLRPGFASDDGRISINSMGYRYREFKKEKGLGIKRIVCVGDSTTFGVNMDGEELTYPGQIEKMLNNGTSMKFEIINAGVPGYTSSQCLLYFKNNLIALSPDAIILYCGWNDLWTYRNPYANTGNAPILRSISRSLGKSYAYMSLKKHVIDPVRNRTSIGEMINVDTGSAESEMHAKKALDYYEKNLIELIEAASKHNIKVFIVSLPTPIRKECTEKERSSLALAPSWSEGYASFYGLKEAYNKRIGRICSNHKAQLIDLDTYIADLDCRHARSLFTDAVHFSNEGNRVIAKQIYEEMKEL